MTTRSWTPTKWVPGSGFENSPSTAGSGLENAASVTANCEPDPVSVTVEPIPAGAGAVVVVRASVVGDSVAGGVSAREDGLVGDVFVSAGEDVTAEVSDVDAGVVLPPVVSGFDITVLLAQPTASNAVPTPTRKIRRIPYAPT